VGFIDANRHRRSAGLVWGVEPICRVLQVAPSTFYAAKRRQPCVRRLRDEQLKAEIRRVYDANFMAYGADKIWAQLNREGIRVARCTVERLMRDMGLSGVTRGNRFKPTTTIGDEAASRPADLIQRRFRAPAPNRLWVADLTYVKTHSGWVYVAFIIDVFSRYVVGWQASRSLRSDLAIDALEMAIWNRQRTGADLSGLVHHSDRGGQYLSIRYSERMADNNIVASVGSKGDSYDNALAESFHGLYKWELIYRHGPWRGLDDVEFATLGYVDWFNHRRLHGEILDSPRYTTPAAYETDHYHQPVTAVEAATQ
jgi:putative transposase